MLIAIDVLNLVVAEAAVMKDQSCVEEERKKLRILKVFVLSWEQFHNFARAVV